MAHSELTAHAGTACAQVRDDSPKNTHTWKSFMAGNGVESRSEKDAGSTMLEVGPSELKKIFKKNYAVSLRIWPQWWDILQDGRSI